MKKIPLVFSGCLLGLVGAGNLLADSLPFFAHAFSLTGLFFWFFFVEFLNLFYLIKWFVYILNKTNKGGFVFFCLSMYSEAVK